MSSGLGSFSYIERDYQDILSAVVERIPNITPEWTDWNQSDIGIAILQLFSGMAEMLAYTEDQHANQLTIPTCTQRESMINLTKSLAYTMSNITAASVDLLFSRTPYITTVSTSGSLTANVAAQTSTIVIDDHDVIYNANDVIYLDNGTTNEYAIIDYVTVVGAISTVSIKGVTRYAYSIGDSVSLLTKNRNVVIPDNLKCVTSSTDPIYFETDIESINYTIYAGSSYVDQTVILSFTSNTITVANSFDYSSEETLYIKSSIFGNSISLTISEISGRVITFSENLPTWLNSSGGDIVSRLVPASQGVTKNEILTASTGLPSQYRTLTYTPLVDTSVVIEVNEGSNYETWTKVDSFFSSDSNDKNYTLQIRATDKGRITFGDNVNGKIPAYNADIRATYIQGGGLVGNVGKNTITRISSSITDVGGSNVSLTVSNPNASSGGAEKESLDTARVRAPALYASTYRAVSLSDFEALSTGYRDAAYGTIAKSQVVESLVDNSVSIYVWAADSSGFATTTSSGLKASLRDYLLERATVGYLVSIVDGYTTAINITASVYVAVGFVQATVRSDVLDIINSLFQVEDLTAGENFYLSNLYEAIESVSGVSRTDITLPLRPGVTISNLHLPIRGTVNLTMVGGN